MGVTMLPPVASVRLAKFLGVTATDEQDTLLLQFPTAHSLEMLWLELQHLGIELGVALPRPVSWALDDVVT